MRAMTETSVTIGCGTSLRRWPARAEGLPDMAEATTMRKSAVLLMAAITAVMASAPVMAADTSANREEPRHHRRRRREAGQPRRGACFAKHPLGEHRADRSRPNRLRARLWRERHPRHDLSGRIALKIRGGDRRHASRRTGQAQPRSRREQRAHLLACSEQSL